MMVLPKINYFFSMIPIKPPATWFKSLDSCISKFLWKDKPPRISLKTLQKAKDRGGLDLPNILHYFLANRLQYIAKWLKPSPQDNPWLNVEQGLCGNLEISDLPFISPNIKYHKCFKSVNISTSLTAWWEFLKITKSSIVPCKHTPIWNNPDILQNKKMLNFIQWKNKGIKNLDNVIQDGNFISFDELMSQYGFSSSSFLEYHQLKSIITKKYVVHQLDLHLPTGVSEYLSICSPKLISKIYKLLSKTDNTIALPSLKWEADLSFTTDSDFWPQICSNIFSMSTNPNLQLIQYKILHRTHYTGQRLFRMGLAPSNICTHCSDNTPDNHAHALWFCPPVHRFWLEVCKELSVWLKCSIPACPKLCILGDLNGINVDRKSAQMVLTVLCIARKTILMNWKSKNNLSINQFRNFLLDHISMEIMSLSSTHQSDEYHSLWSPLISLIT